MSVRCDSVCMCGITPSPSLTYTHAYARMGTHVDAHALELAELLLRQQQIGQAGAGGVCSMHACWMT